MDSVYLICLLVGGFFVVLSMFGGDTDADVDIDADVDVDADTGTGVGAGAGFVDLFSLRFAFLFALFFGLTGVLLDAFGRGEPVTFLVSLGVGLVLGLSGNYAIKRLGRTTVSSDVQQTDLVGLTARVVVPFSEADKGKIRVDAKGQRLQLVARGLEGSGESYAPGDDVVIVRVDGPVAEVVRPD
ncbi:MAG: hypothetical protein AAF752_03375 [Bacteroidota bacterium]